ncbi:uncharacterized protein LOC121834202 [Ixodes scapularis]|uniref:uncharacterized protein LOC121834202 n=1 Tax=Ixodes scapularis TaxID=6945 RepID=UPI001C384CF3|nr:uncharacterized protein LOC121834202 [Ixodes scapularis]
MQDVIARFRTFEGCQMQYPTPRCMAFAGFRRLLGVNFCQDCNLVVTDEYLRLSNSNASALGMWVHPHKLHAAASPDCKFIKTYRDPRLFVDFDPVVYESPVHPTMCNVMDRMTSFGRYSKYYKEFANAGFFMRECETAEGDVTCFYCGMQAWMGNFNEEDPWVLHARHSPHCFVLRMLKSEDFIRKTVTDYRLSERFWALALPEVKSLLMERTTRSKTLDYLRMYCDLSRPDNVRDFVAAISDKGYYDFRVPARLLNPVVIAPPCVPLVDGREDVDAPDE